MQQYQEDALREILTPDENGKYPYSIVVWSDIKKSYKSTIAAAVNLARATHTDWGEYYIVANDLKQAFSRVSMYLRRGVDLNPQMRGKYKTIGYRVETPSNSFIESIPIDPGGEAGSNADQISFSELWAANQDAQMRMWCLDDETQVLTRDGWKDGTSLTTNDYVAVYDDRKSRVLWEKPRSVFCEPYSGPMHLYEHKNFSILCTPDHRLFGRYSYSGNKLGKDPYETVGVMRSNELRASGYAYYHPQGKVEKFDSVVGIRGIEIKGTKFHESKFIPIEKWASFLGLYLSEGSTSDYRGVPCHVRVSQLEKPHPEQYKEIFDILKDAFGDWAKLNQKDGFKISNTELAKITKKFGKTFEKRVPRYIIDSGDEAMRNLLYCYILGDGHTRRDGAVEIVCANRNMADDLQEISFRLGMQSSVRPVGKYWRLYIYSQVISPSFHKKHWKEVSYNGKVWCPSVSTGLFVARRAGRPFITGNTEMTIPPGKHGKAFRWIESYAGFLGESKLLYSLYELGVKQGELLWPDRLYPVTDGEPTPLELYVNKEARMICLWNTQPRCPEQTREYYSSEQKILTPNEFLRVHRNQWVTNTETFVPMAWFDSCKREEKDWPKYNKKNIPMIIAMDAGVSNDNFGMALGFRHPELNDEVCLERVMRWTPKGGKIDFQGTSDNPGPELILEQWIAEFNVVQVCYDPYQLHDMATRMKKKALTWFKSFNQGNDRLLADSQLRNVIRDRKFWHRGEVDLREHMQNADAKTDTEDHKIRIVKRADSLKVDLAVTTSMMTFEVLRLNL